MYFISFTILFRKFSTYTGLLFDGKVVVDDDDSINYFSSL